MSHTLPGKRGQRRKGKQWSEASSGVPDQTLLPTMPLALQRRKPAVDALCKEGASGELHPSEAACAVAWQLSTQQLDP